MLSCHAILLQSWKNGNIYEEQHIENLMNMQASTPSLVQVCAGCRMVRFCRDCGPKAWQLHRHICRLESLPSTPTYVPESGVIDTVRQATPL